MTERPGQLPSVIATRRLRLVPLSVDAADEMVDVLGGEELYEFIGGEPPTLDRLRARYERQVVGGPADESQQWHNWIIRRASDGGAVGYVQATVIDEGRHADIAWVVGLAWQRRSYASEATQAMVDWLRTRGVVSFTAHIHPEHDASIKVAERVGLVQTEEYVEGERTWRMSVG